jgi:hypothetical protein
MTMTLEQQAHAALDRWRREAPVDGLTETEILALYDYILWLEQEKADED